MQLVNDIKITEGLFLENGLLSGISSVRLNNENTTNSNDIFKRKQTDSKRVVRETTKMVRPLSINKISNQNTNEVSVVNKKKNVSKSDYSRTGNLMMGDDATISRGNGSLAFIPSLEGFLNVKYTIPLTTGNELPAETDVLKDFTVNVDGTILLDKNITVNDTLKIIAGILNTNGYTVTTGSSAIADADPNDIIGNILGEPVYVGTGEYENSFLGISVSAGNDIGNLSVMLFTHPTQIGETDGICRTWWISEDNNPVGREMTISWSIDADNEIDLSNVQVWHSQNSESEWFACGEILDISDATDTRSILISNVESYDEWTIAEGVFSLSTNLLDFGDVVLGDSETQQFSITNLEESALSGTINVPVGYTISEVSTTRNIKSIKKSKEQPENNRDEISFNISSGSSQEFELTFSPTLVTDYDGNVTIITDGFNNPSRNLSVLGAVLDQEIVITNIQPNPGSVIISELDSIHFAISATDPDGNELEYSWKLDAEEVSTDSTYDFVTDYESAGEYSVTLDITDNFGVSKNRDNISYIWDVTIIAPPLAPTNINITITLDEASHLVRTITWNAVEGADYYNVYCCDTPNGEFAKINDVPITETTFETVGASAMKFFHITANNGGMTTIILHKRDKKKQ